jgi:hypothetical protein
VERPLLLSAFSVPVGLVLGAINPVLLALGAILIDIIVLFLLFMFCKGFILTAGKEATRAIVVGVVIGGITGLAYGWTYLAFGPTTIAMVFGAAVGLGAGYLVHRVGKAAWFIRLCELTDV